MPLLFAYSINRFSHEVAQLFCQETQIDSKICVEVGKNALFSTTAHIHEKPIAVFKSSMSVSPYSIAGFLNFILRNKKQAVLSHWYM